MHELSEHTKRAIDLVSPVLTGAAAATAALTLQQLALVVTIATGLLSAAWYVMRFYDRFKYGRRAD
jgi:hypothetical protein